MADIQVANTDADLSGNTVLTEENGYTITGLHTFSRSTNAPFACISGAAYVQYLDADKVDGVEAAALLRVDGSLALSANWDAGGYEIRSSTFESDVSTGTAPLTIASTTLVANLNADKLDSQEGTYYLAAANITGTTLASGVVTSSLTAVGTIATGVWNGTAVTVAYGGTGATSLTDGGVLLGSGTGAVTSMAVLADSEMIVGDGSTDPVAESGATLRTSIGCDSASNITSGTLANARLPTNIDVGGTLDVTGATTLDSTLGVVGAVTFNDAGADVDFRVESDDNQNMLFVDGGNDRVGIGTNVPSQPLTVSGVIVAQETFEIATPTVQSNKGVGVYVGGQSDDEVSVAVVSLTDDIAGASRAWSLVNGRTDSTQTVGTLNFLAATANSQDPLDGAVTVMSLDDNGDVDVAGVMNAAQYHTAVSAAISTDGTTNLYASSGASGSGGGMIAMRDGYGRFGLFWYGSYDTLTKLAGNSVYSASKDNASTINIYYESGNIVYQNKTAVASLSVHYTRILD